MREMVRQEKLKQEKERLARMQLKHVHQIQQKEHNQESVTPSPPPHPPSLSFPSSLLSSLCALVGWLVCAGHRMRRLNKEVYVNPVQPAFFEQFGTSHR